MIACVLWCVCVGVCVCVCVCVLRVGWLGVVILIRSVCTLCLYSLFVMSVSLLYLITLSLSIGDVEAEAEWLAEIAARRAAWRKKWHAEKRQEAWRKAKAALSTEVVARREALGGPAESQGHRCVHRCVHRHDDVPAWTRRHGHIYTQLYIHTFLSLTSCSKL